MRLGPIEIILIIVVIIAAVIIARIIRTGRESAKQNGKSATDTTVKPSESKASRLPGFLGRTGIALMIAGGIALIAGISMLKWAIHNYVLSFILIVVGIIIFTLSRRKG